MYKKILIIGHSNMGDVLHNMAILKPLFISFPKASIQMLTSPTGKMLLDGNPYLSHIFIFDKFEKHRPFKKKLELIFKLRKEHFDLVINLKKGSYFAYFLGAKKIWHIPKGDNTLEAKRTIHSIERYLHIMQKHNLCTEDIDMKVSYSKQDQNYIEILLKEKGHDFKKPLVIFAPFSAWHAKEWEPQKLGSLAKKLSIEHHKSIVFVGGEKDQMKMNSFHSFKEYFIDLIGKTSVKELAALYDKAEFAIGVDSGPFHLASNMKVPALGLFGPTSHFLGQPYFTPQYTILCEENLGCNPCIPGPHFLACKVYDQTTPCMKAISFETVYKKVQQVLIDVDQLDK